jgi:nucleoside phosphorylase
MAKKIKVCPASEYLGQVDFALITIRDDEYKAALDRFPTEVIARGHSDYSIAHVDSVDGGIYHVAVVRCVSQGNIKAEKVAGELIRDLQPRWIITVGIAGGVPDRGFTLGDVIISNHIHNFTVSARKMGGETTFSATGGPVHGEVERVIAALRSRPDLIDSFWGKPVGCERPLLSERRDSIVARAKAARVGKQKLAEFADYEKKLEESLELHFVQHGREGPVFDVRPVASSDTLMKDVEIVLHWLNTGRHIAAIEMESAGVYEAARGLHSDNPMVTIRGVSDIVGLPRDERWTEYACHSAAAFAYSLIKFGRVFDARPGTRQNVVQPAAVTKSINQFSYKTALVQSTFNLLKNAGVFDFGPGPTTATPADIAADLPRAAGIISYIDSYATFYTYTEDEIVPFTIDRVLKARDAIIGLTGSCVWAIPWVNNEVQGVLHHMAGFTRFYPIDRNDLYRRIPGVPFNHHDPGFDTYEQRLITMRFEVWARMARLTRLFGLPVLPSHLPSEVYLIAIST